jgi:hypothetical protein
MNGMAMLSAGQQPHRKCDPALDCVHGKIWLTINYPEGGSCTMWHTDGSSASDFEENKENEIPQAFLYPCHSHKSFSSTTEADTSNSTDLPCSIPSKPSLEV